MTPAILSLLAFLLVITVLYWWMTPQERDLAKQLVVLLAKQAWAAIGAGIAHLRGKPKA